MDEGAGHVVDALKTGWVVTKLYFKKNELSPEGEARVREALAHLRCEVVF